MNSVQLSGRLTKDLELRRLDNSNKTAVINFMLAVDKEMSKEKKRECEDQGKQTADFIPVRVFGKPAENCAKYLEKGSKVIVIGKITTGSYITQTGEIKYTMQITADRVEFIGAKKSNRNQSPIDFYDEDCFLDNYNYYDEYDESPLL
ncbi:MAG TPA: single-stranded DNA-binding protein [Clostridiales bacterium]|nr:single-stranded DNA-binding protein [Clostridiales bacterium]